MNVPYQDVPAKDLSCYIQPAIAETGEAAVQQHRDIVEYQNGEDIQDIYVGVWQRIWFILDVMLMTFPLWCPGSILVTRRGGLIEVIYMPPKSFNVDTDSFIRRVIWYTSKIADHFVRHAEVERIDIWASGVFKLDENNRQKTWKGLSLSIKVGSTGHYSHGSISNFAKAYPERYLEHNSARWVRKNQFPEWIYIPVDTGGI